MRSIVMLLVLATILPARSEPQTLGAQRVNTWAARSSSGQTFGGTFTATEDAKTGAVSGQVAIGLERQLARCCGRTIWGVQRHVGRARHSRIQGWTT